jgi:hypothetical protein
VVAGFNSYSPVSYELFEVSWNASGVCTEEWRFVESYYTY